MIGNELILLGLLKESPKHGYEIKKKAEDIASLFAGLNLGSIYYPLRVLEKKGLVVKRVTRSGKRPLRLVYELTPKGRSRFKDLVSESFLNFTRPQFSLDLSLYFLDAIEPAIAKRRLRARMVILKKLSSSLRKSINSLFRRKPSSLARILEHNLEMVETEYRFLAKLTSSI